MFFPHNVSDQSISVFFNGRMCSVPASDPIFAELREHLAGAVHEYAVVENLVDKPTMISRMSEGLVTVIGSTVYYKGQSVHTTLTKRLLDVLDAGHNAIIWARFLERVMANPSDRSRQCLYDFLNHWKAPLTEDGHFIAFKRVREDYTPIHRGGDKFDNSPGSVVEMPRENVDANPDATCSYGLHVAASSYLGSFATAEGNRTIACKVDPADVVAVPRDYGFAKMRVCRYFVIGDAEESFYNNAHESVMAPVAAESSKEYIAPDEEPEVCEECGSTLGVWDYLCQDCQAAKDEEDDDAWQEIVDDVDEHDHIAETGCTRDGVPVGSDYVDPYSHGHNVSRFGLDEPDDAPPYVVDAADAEDDETSVIAFERAGVTYTATAIKNGIAKNGQRGYSRLTGVPRTTLQDWLLKIEVTEG